MNTNVATSLERPRRDRLRAFASGVARSPRAAAVMALGPLTMIAGVVWAFAQPYRVTVLHPHGQGFWWLFVEPPVLVVAVGALFALCVAPGLVDDLAEAESQR